MAPHTEFSEYNEHVIYGKLTQVKAFRWCLEAFFYVFAMSWLSLVISNSSRNNLAWIFFFSFVVSNKVQHVTKIKLFESFVAPACYT